jgi:hypothetical protein
MSQRKVVLTMLLGTCFLLFSVAFAAPVSDHQAGNAGSAIRTTLQADLTLKSTLSPELFATAAFHQKTCRCSCGYPCNQDEDCGPGGVCEQFISCCDRNQPNPSTQQSGRSTRQGEVSAVAVNVKCK